MPSELQHLRDTAVYYLISTLNDVGKTKIQKLLYFAQEGYGLQTNFDIQMYHYGPYSFEIDDQLSRLRFRKLIEIEHDPYGYGFHVRPRLVDDAIKATLVPDPDEQRAIDEAIRRFGHMDAKELELRATIHFVASIAEAASDKEVIGHVNG